MASYISQTYFICVQISYNTRYMDMECSTANANYFACKHKMQVAKPLTAQFTSTNRLSAVKLLHAY